MYRISNISLAVLFTFSCAMAGTAAIGTASARGSMVVDGSVVNGNATLFDGTVLETGQATTAVRLDKGIEIKLATDSRGKLYRDRLVLEKGAGELDAPGRFVLQASGLSVTSSAPNSRGIVSMQQHNQVQVSALEGSFNVADRHGLLLASVQPGRMMTFNMQDTGGANAPATYTGVLTKETDRCAANGGTAYYITVNGVKYQVVGENLDAFIGKTVTVTGTLQGTQPTKCAAGGIIGSAGGTTAATGSAAAVAGMSVATKAIIVVSIVAAAGLTAGLIVANQSSKPASP